MKEVKRAIDAKSFVCAICRFAVPVTFIFRNALHAAQSTTKEKLFKLGKRYQFVDASI